MVTKSLRSSNTSVLRTDHVILLAWNVLCVLLESVVSYKGTVGRVLFYGALS